VIYVCPVFPGENGELADFCRLYAFPRKPAPPPPGGFCLLDSGAFGLSQRKQVMDARYISILRRFYQKRVSSCVFGIAPDEYLNPQVSQRRFASWRKQAGPAIVPVIQLSARRRLDLHLIVSQSRFYLSYRDELPQWRGRPFVAISNPGLLAAESGMLKHAVGIIRQDWGDVWLHNLGAGWSPDDVRRWRDMDCFDSIDSIAYYTSAQEYMLWTEAGLCSECQMSWQKLAVDNAAAAVRIAANKGERKFPFVTRKTDRDENAARNILALALAFESSRTGPSGVNVADYGVRSLRSSPL
jgi:hypothetical protein